LWRSFPSPKSTYRISPCPCSCHYSPRLPHVFSLHRVAYHLWVLGSAPIFCSCTRLTGSGDSMLSLFGYFLSPKGFFLWFCEKRRPFSLSWSWTPTFFFLRLAQQFSLPSFSLFLLKSNSDSFLPPFMAYPFQSHTQYT